MRHEISTKGLWIFIGEVIDMPTFMSSDQYSVAYRVPARDLNGNYCLICLKLMKSIQFDINTVKPGVCLSMPLAYQAPEPQGDATLIVASISEIYTKIFPFTAAEFWQMDEMFFRQRDYCWSCGGKNKSTCQKCGCAKYCSRDCQLADWPQHKKFCKGKFSLFFSKSHCNCVNVFSCYSYAGFLACHQQGLLRLTKSSAAKWKVGVGGKLRPQVGGCLFGDLQLCDQ